jgi:pre-mRNA-splicing factor SYF1
MGDELQLDLRAVDIPFEEDCLRLPTLLRNWTRYTAHLVETQASQALLKCVFDRAVHNIPFSYKLWKLYIDWCLSTEWSDLIFTVYKRATIELPKFPKIWLGYAAACVRYGRIELGLSVLDLSLRSLPITQHARIWDFYKIHFCQLLSVRGQIAPIVDIWRRWLQLHPNKRDTQYAESMIQLKCLDEAAVVLQQLAHKKDDKALSLLLELLAKNPQISCPGVDSIIQSAIKRNPKRCGPLWNILSARAIQRQDYRTAQAIFEQALNGIVSVEDFCMVFEAYSIFLETLCSAFIESNLGGLYLAKLERLLKQRKILLHNVLVRLQPDNVDFWLERLRLIKEEHGDDFCKVLTEYERAVKTVNAKNTDRFYLLWIDFAKLYISKGDFDSAFSILDHAASSKVRLIPEDHACLLIEYSKLKVASGGGSVEDGLQIISRGCVPNAPSYKTATLWNYLVDFQEALALRNEGNQDLVNSVVETYNKIIDLKVATAQTFINYAEFVMRVTGDHNRQFAIYERGIAAFGWPICFELWNIYLPKAVSVLPKLPLGVERLRDLFAQALLKCPDQFAAAIVIMYCKFEEEHGLARNCLRILDVAVNRPLLSVSDRSSLFKLFIARTKTLSGLADLRTVYERSIKSLSEDVDAMVTVAIEWARLEASMGEMVRCRALLVHVAEQAVHDDRLWSSWEALEQEFGDERSFRDMLRLKRAITEKHARKHGSLMASFVPATTSVRKVVDEGDIADPKTMVPESVE